jgi:diguanylate cyclase (GGDEF)-like protein
VTIGIAVHREQTLTHRQVARELAPFAGASLLAWGAVIVGSSIDWTQYAFATALLVAAGILTFLHASGRPQAWTSGRPARWVGIVPSSLVFLAAVGLLRNSAGGMTSGAGALAMVPVFYTALHATRRSQMVAVLGGLAVFYLAPILLVGAPQYPDSQYRTALLSVAVSSIIGFATQLLVRDVRKQATEAQARGEMLEQVNETVRSLFESPRARVDVCEAARRISRATAALLYEPLPESDHLGCTATSGIAGATAGVAAQPQSVANQVFRTGRAVLVTENVEAQVGSVALWIASGRPSSVLYQPLRKGGVTIGVLVVGWPDAVNLDGPRATVTALLAHEAAAVIDRADALDFLTDEARTDPLTGLPNRRAWDAELQRAMAQRQQLSVAMLDLDHFKEFNDTYGHPAGDRLLKETTAAWREQVRTGDLLARVGGEEFALLLSCGAREALEIVERLRERVSQNRTCSAGIAAHQPGESAEALLARVDRALYDAKAEGRDRSHLSGSGAVATETCG